MLTHPTLNQLVQGSSPCAPTTAFSDPSAACWNSTPLTGQDTIHLRIIKRQRDEPRGIAHFRADQDLMLALRLGLAQCFAHIVGIGNGLAADFEDDVTVLETQLGGRTVRLDRGDNDASLASAGDFPRWCYLQPQMRNATPWLCAITVSLDLPLVRHFRQCRRDGSRLATTNNVEFD